MAERDIGRVVPIYKGDYSAGTQYELNDVVMWTDDCAYWHYGTSATIGVAPSNTAVWKLLVKRGASAYEQAVQHGYDDTEETFYDRLSRVKEYCDDAAAAATAAQGAQGAAESAASDAETSKTGAASSASAAASSAATATSAKTAAQTAKAGAETAATEAASSATAAQTAQSLAEEAAEEAQAATESLARITEAQIDALFEGGE